MQRFLHSSDWQLGKPFGRLSPDARAALQDARLDAIDALAATARSRGLDTILVAGDVFDSPEPGDRVFRQAISRMKAADPIRWFLIPGNHDPAREDGLWFRFAREAPDNVRAILKPEIVPLSDDMVLLSAPLTFKRTVDDPTQWFDSAETAPGVRRIGLAHGAVRSFGRDGDLATNLIAPDRARRAGLDYLALGDWHGMQTIDPRTAYSGTPEADDFGREQTGMAIVVTLAAAAAADAPPALETVQTGRYAWRDISWTIAGPGDLDRHIDALAREHDLKRLVLRLSVQGVLSLAERIHLRDALESRLAHEVRWLDLRLDGLVARPTDNDLSDIDAQGVLRDVAEQLKAKSADPGDAGRRALAALERLYLEHQLAQRSVAD